MQRLFQIKINGKVIGHINQVKLEDDRFSFEVLLIKIQKIEANGKKNNDTVNVPKFEIPRLFKSDVTKNEMEEQINEFVCDHFTGDYTIEA
jgi:hypothetical protein